ncbi:hypothetical protein BpHYR1_051127 [Brachionus plicatilis]|uniref:Uncharacterized protein n=1 Tax=Brachionus plicatilis TaxID=10195 RepID=A0A3M7PHW6_BRAPC|nr:hypothetical protein BpHYR1_051127 [Brachionus plicatilis]
MNFMILFLIRYCDFALIIESSDAAKLVAKKTLSKQSNLVECSICGEFLKNEKEQFGLTLTDPDNRFVKLTYRLSDRRLDLFANHSISCSEFGIERCLILSLDHLGQGRLAVLKLRVGMATEEAWLYDSTTWLKAMFTSLSSSLLPSWKRSLKRL